MQFMPIAPQFTSPGTAEIGKGSTLNKETIFYTLQSDLIIIYLVFTNLL